MRLTRISVRPRHQHHSGGHRSSPDGVLGRHTAASSAHAPTCTEPRRATSRRNTPPISERIGGRRWGIPRRVPLVAGLVAAVLFASGATTYAESPDSTVVLAIAGSIDEVLTNIRNWLMGILAGLATVFLTIGGVRRVFGGGDPGEQEKSKEAFKAAGIGYGLAALAPLVVTVLKGIVGA
jgi:Type IV secretion system pilin